MDEMESLIPPLVMPVLTMLEWTIRDHALLKSESIDPYYISYDTPRDATPCSSLEDHVRSCDEVRETGLCSPTTCPDAVIPEGDCCPVCGEDTPSH